MVRIDTHPCEKKRAKVVEKKQVKRINVRVARFQCKVNKLLRYAAIAQLAERRHGKAKVTGSNPVRGSIRSKLLESSSGNDKRL